MTSVAIGVVALGLLNFFHGSHIGGRYEARYVRDFTYLRLCPPFPFPHLIIQVCQVQIFAGLVDVPATYDLILGRLDRSFQFSNVIARLLQK